MLTSFFGQPTWPVAITTLLAAFGTLVLQQVLNRRTKRMDEELRVHSAQLGERNADIAAMQADLKRTELKSGATAKWAELVERRTDCLQVDFAELIGLLQVYGSERAEPDRKTRVKIAQLALSVSLALPPSGKFAEELTVQLGHVREAVEIGPSYLVERSGLLWALQNNAWTIVGAERHRVLEGIAAGEQIERSDLEPHRWRPSISSVSSSTKPVAA